MASEQRVEDGAATVNESEQDRSMARLAEILRENGIRVGQVFEANEIPYYPTPVISFSGTKADGFKGG